MPSTEEQVKSVILKYKSGVHKQQIARELKMGLEYIGLICRELERKGNLVFRNGLYSLMMLAHKPTKRRPRVSRRKPRITIPNNSAKLARKVSAKSVLLAIPKMTEGLIDVLEGAGYKTIESLADAPLTRFMQETKLELQEAARLINQARKALNKIGE